MSRYEACGGHSGPLLDLLETLTEIDPTATIEDSFTYGDCPSCQIMAKLERKP